MKAGPKARVVTHSVVSRAQGLARQAVTSAEALESKPVRVPVQELVEAPLVVR